MHDEQENNHRWPSDFKDSDDEELAALGGALAGVEQEIELGDDAHILNNLQHATSGIEGQSSGGAGDYFIGD